METVANLTMEERLCKLVKSGGKVAASMALAFTLGASAAFVPAMAFADTGEITIQTTSNANAVYKVYQVFAADMIDNEDSATNASHPRLATHIDWANSAVKTAALAFMDEHGYGDWLSAREQTAADAHDLPQNAALFIAEQIGASLDDADAAVPQTKKGQTFALELAKTLDQALDSSSAGVSTYEPYAGGAQEASAFSADSGYYLFVTDDSSVSADESGTSPLWVPLGGSPQTVNEKTAIPTVDKLIMEDSAGTFGKAADANKDQVLSYKLVGTLPDNYQAFDTYHYCFTDTFSAGLDLAYAESGELADSVRVMLNPAQGSATDITGDSNVSVSYDAQTRVLSVDIADLKKVSDAIDKDTVVTVEYQAHLNESAAIGAQGNQNGVVLTYTSNPVTEAEGTTLPEGQKTYAYTYQLLLNKVDKQTSEALSGAKFTMRVAQTQGSADSASVGQYVQSDGSLAADAYEFETVDGVITVPRIDEGTYTLHETVAPAGYEVGPDITLAISSVFDEESGMLTNLGATVSGGVVDQTVDTDVVTHVEQDDNATSTGTITLVTSDDKKVSLPVTGLDGVTAATMCGSGAIALGLAGWFATRRKRSVDE